MHLYTISVCKPVIQAHQWQCVREECAGKCCIPIACSTCTLYMVCRWNTAMCKCIAMFSSLRFWGEKWVLHLISLTIPWPVSLFIISFILQAWRLKWNIFSIFSTSPPPKFFIHFSQNYNTSITIKIFHPLLFSEPCVSIIGLLGNNCWHLTQGQSLVVIKSTWLLSQWIGIVQYILYCWIHPWSCTLY